MPHHSKPETLSGNLQRLLFSPKGGIEGLLLSVQSKTVQVSLDSRSVDAHALASALGKPIELQAFVDHSPKTKDSVHTVYELEHITTVAGETFKSTENVAAVRGVVAAIHYAKHGEPNGVILESGEFVHTRPPGMKKLKLKVGSKVEVYGDTRMTVLGTALIEASEVNQTTLE